ncbi:MAG: Co2+/Mg2+ efflux protein ApaG [Myxococcota bacterium]|nr:Co2+/Mg2+ efflux protein ApaG [Myxococcales bacterium]
MSTSTAITDGIRVSVEAEYSPAHSAPEQSEWFFLYTVTIENESDRTVQLLSRHWMIVDATGRHQEVRGPGVVGEQPVLEPGDRYQYTSGCPLATPFGAMQGSYRMTTADDREFDVAIARFELRERRAIH